MSRTGYSDDLEPWALIRWRGAVKSAMRGKRGRAFLEELLAALDALPDKRLVMGALEDQDGGVCALGCIGRTRGLDLGVVDPEDYDEVARTFGVAGAMAREIMYWNDDYLYGTPTPEERYRCVRRLVEQELATPPRARR